MESIIGQMEEGKLLITLSKEVYEKDAIMAAAYKMTEACTILIRPMGEDAWGVVFEQKGERKQSELETIAKNFCNEVLDQQIRLSLEKSSGTIRELITMV
ncbi:MAG TPA: His-Xaa-Ser system protein HxsD [Candidatus Atribacteria bacterium]|nr:His-Xaa-Ser system protein HxsD [Candidatus Atribacteria bacterium]